MNNGARSCTNAVVALIAVPTRYRLGCGGVYPRKL